jgi:hypothetical protein
LLPGGHRLSENGTGNNVAFAIDASGNVTFDSSLSGILASPGPHQLIVTGVALSVSQNLSDPLLAVDYYVNEQSAPTFQLQLLPGGHRLSENGTGNNVAFAIDASGNVTFDSSLNGILASPGPHQLIVTGVALSVSQNLSDPLLAVDYYINEQSSPTFQLQLLPGSHRLSENGTGNNVAFAIDASGNVTFDSSLNGILASPGPHQLIVTGVALSVSQNLSDPLLAVDYYINEQSAPTFQLQLLPGSHLLSEVATGNKVPFAVDASGNVTFDSSVSGILASPGPHQLTVSGVGVVINAAALTPPNFILDYYTTAPTSAKFQASLLPGTHLLAPQGSAGQVSFAVDAQGNLSIEPPQSGVLVSPGPHQLTVYGVGTMLNLQVSSTLAVVGQPVTLTATITPASIAFGLPTGTVTFQDSATVLGTAPLNNGVATFQTANLAVGSHVLSVIYNGAGFFRASTSAFTQTISRAATTVALTSSTNPVALGQSMVLTARLGVVAPGAGVPTGAVTFMDGTTVLGTGTLSNGVATLQTASLALGNHALTAVYGGDSNFMGSTSAPLNETVLQASKTTLQSSLATSTFGQTITLTAAVMPTTGSGTATGTVTFKDGTSVLGSATLSSGKATLTTALLTAGSHTLSVVFSGNPALAGSTSAALTQTVKSATTTASLTLSANPAVFGQPITLTARVRAVAPGAGVPSGTITFKDGTTVLGTATLSNGVAVYQTAALAVGKHSLSAGYSGDGNFTGSSAAAVTETINKAATTTVLISPMPGPTITLQAQVAVVAPGAATPTGTVTFKDGTTVLGTGAVSGGVALLQTKLGKGKHQLTAIYSGDANVTTSTSAGVTVTI